MDKLIKDIGEVFKDDEINTEDIRRILSNYKSNPLDWKKYAHFDAHKYTRNLVDEGNGKYNMLILCWGPGMASSIHDHTNSHCFVKVLDGSLTETLYDWPNEGEKDVPLNKKKESTYGVNEVTYMSDEIGLHRMENPSHSDGCVTLHLYIPAYDTCKIFDERTGRNSKSVVTFYTKYGQKVDYNGSKTGRVIPQSEIDSQVVRSPFSFV